MNADQLHSNHIVQKKQILQIQEFLIHFTEFFFFFKPIRQSPQSFTLLVNKEVTLVYVHFITSAPHAFALLLLFLTHGLLHITPVVMDVVVFLH